MDAKQSFPPLPDFFCNTYRQYKQTSNIIVHWVHETVAALRERTRVHANPPTRARAQGSRAKNATKRPQPTQDPDLASPKFSLRIFLSLVREIAASDVVIPKSQLALLEMSIKQRKQMAAFYSPDANAAENNASHRFAIDAYSQALEILKEAAKKSAQKDGGLAEEIDSTFALQASDNAFALSESIQQLIIIIEEEGGCASSSAVGSSENEWLRDNPAVNPTQKTKKPRMFPLEEYEVVPDDYSDKKTKKPKTPIDETFEAIRCFLLDLHRMRQYCNQVWSNVVPVGKTSHVAASFVTNKAVQLVKQMEYALVADFPVLKDIDHAYAILMKTVLPKALHGATQDMFDSFMDQTMYYTWDSLQQFSGIQVEKSVPLLRDGHFGYFDPSANRGQMSNRERHAEDRCIMCNHWPDLIIASLTSTSWIGDQGLGKDFKAFWNNKSRPVTWALVFACQMQADSVQARRRYLQYDLQVLRNLGSKVIKSYDDFLSDGVLYDNNMDYFARPHLRKRKEEVVFWLQTDPVTEYKLLGDWDKISKQACQKDALFLQNSWLTANAISETILDYFFCATAAMVAGGFVQSAIQLWNMLKHTGHLISPPATVVARHDTTAGKDHVLLFDHLLEVFGDKVFSGPPPKSGFLKQWELMMGVRAEEFASGKRQYKKTADQPLRPRAHGGGRGILPTISDAWNMHEDKYFSTRRSSSASQKRGLGSQEYRHPLAATLDLVNSEMGQSTATPLSFQGLQSGSSPAPAPRGPLLNLDLLKIHRLSVRIFTELEPVIRPEVERVFREPLNHTQIN